MACSSPTWNQVRPSYVRLRPNNSRDPPFPFPPSCPREVQEGLVFQPSERQRQSSLRASPRRLIGGSGHHTRHRHDQPHPPSCQDHIASSSSYSIHGARTPLRHTRDSLTLKSNLHCFPITWRLELTLQGTRDCSCLFLSKDFV